MSKRKTFVIFAVAGLLGLIAGCPAKGDGDAQIAAELAVNRARWLANGPSSYEFRYRRLCFCPVDAVREVALTVRDDEVRGAVYIDDGSPVPQADLEDYPTVDGLFAIIQSAIDSGADSITVEYDPDLGFPARIALDFAAGASDDEITHTAADVEGVP